jgi:hypothetical protein
MDYFQGVVLEYLRADRGCFVNPEFWLRGNPKSAHDRPHWFVDVLAVHMKFKTVFLCEVTFARQPRALIQRLRSWKDNWQIVNDTLKEDTGIDKSWPVIPWIFASPVAMNIIKPELTKLFPQARDTLLTEVVPWEYCTYDRKDKIKEIIEEEVLPDNV